MADLGIRHLTRTESSGVIEHPHLTTTIEVKKPNTVTTPTKGKPKGKLSRFLSFIRGGKNNNKKGSKARQKSTDSTSSGVSSNGVSPFAASSGDDNDPTQTKHESLGSRAVSRDSGNVPGSLATGLDGRTLSGGKPNIQIVRTQSAQAQRQANKAKASSSTRNTSKTNATYGNTPRRANTTIGGKSSSKTRNPNEKTSTETSTSDSSSTGYLSDESHRRKNELRNRHANRMQNSRHPRRQNRNRDDSSEETTSTSGDSYSSSEDSVYSSAELNGNTNIGESDEEGSSSHSEITGTGGETTELEALQQYALETIPEDGEERETEKDELNQAHNGLESEDAGSLFGEKEHQQKSIDSGNGLHKPKPIWRRRVARPTSFDNAGYSNGKQIISRSESERGPVLSSRIKKFEPSNNAQSGNVKAIAKKLQAQTEAVQEEDDVYLASQFARARRFFRSGSHEGAGQQSPSKEYYERSGNHQWLDSHDNDDDLLLEANCAPVNLTTRRAGMSQVREGRATLSRKNSFPSTAAAQAAAQLPPDDQFNNKRAQDHGPVQRSTSRVRQIAMSLHERESAVRTAEAMIANHQPLVDHAASASSSSERASTGQPSPPHRPRTAKKTDDSFIKELLEIARAESQEKHREHIDPKILGHLGQSSTNISANNRTHSQTISLGGMDDAGLTDDGERKPKDFKEAISMASNRMIRKKQPSQDHTEPEMDGGVHASNTNIHHSSTTSSKLVSVKSTESITSQPTMQPPAVPARDPQQPTRRRMTSSDYQYQSQVKLRMAEFENKIEELENNEELASAAGTRDASPSKIKVKKVIKKVKRVKKQPPKTITASNEFLDSEISQPSVTVQAPITPPSQPTENPPQVKMRVVKKKKIVRKVLKSNLKVCPENAALV